MRLVRWLTILLASAVLLPLFPGRAVAAAPVVAAAGDIGCPLALQFEGMVRPMLSRDGVPTWPYFCQQAETAGLVEKAGDYNAVLALGDLLAPDAALVDFENSYGPSWGAFKSITLPAVGNHEYSGGEAEGFFDYFKDRRVGGWGEGWYKRRLGRWLVIGLNSNCNHVGCGSSSTQVRWLKNLLRKNRKMVRAKRSRGSTCILAFWHHPRFSSGRHGDTYDTGAFWRTLRRFNADVVLNGHDHLYERFMPLAPSGAAEAGGITQFTVGTGGRSLFSFVGEPHPGSEVRIEREFGILRLRLLPRAFRWNFITVDGQVRDYGTRSC